MNPALALGVVTALAAVSPADTVRPDARDPDCVQDCWRQYQKCMDECWDALRDNVACDQSVCNPRRQQCDAECPTRDPQRPQAIY